MNRQEVLRKHKDYLFLCMVNYYMEPLVADRGAGQYLWDQEGKRRLDFFGGVLTVGLGHCAAKADISEGIRILDKSLAEVSN